MTGNRRLITKILILSAIIVILVTGGTIFGCTSSVPLLGWSGVVVTDSNLVFGNVRGQLIVMDKAGGTPTLAAPLETTPQSGGFLSCSTSPPTVGIYGTPVLSADIIYIGSYLQQGKAEHGRVYAFNPGRNEPRWVYPRDSFLSAPIIGSLAISQGKVYFGGADGKVYALDAADGFMAWDRPYQTGNKIWSTPVISGNTLFIGSTDHHLYALDAATGKKLWYYRTNGAIVAPPVVSGDTVYFGSLDRYLYAVNTLDGNLKWRSSFTAGSWFWSQPLISGQALYAASLDGKVYAVNITNGDKMTEWNLPGQIASTPVLLDNSIIVATENGVVYSIDITKIDSQPNKLVDVKDRILAPLSISNGLIYIQTQKGTIQEVDAKTGTVKQLYSISSK